jgi:hypothetical protein
MMNHKNMVVLFVAVLFLVGACNLASHTIQGVPPTSVPQSVPSQLETATQPVFSGQSGSGTATKPPLTGGNGQSGSKPDILGSFPLPPNSQITSPDSSDPSDSSGSFTVQSQSSPDAVAKFYADALPMQGWSLRYTDANFTGGVNQYWKKDNIYLTVNIGFVDGQLTIHCQYNLVEAQAAQKLPMGFPLPGQAEMVSAEDTSWEFYIPQDYSAVTNFYKGKMASINWKQTPGSGNGAGGQGSCGDADCGGNTTFPTGAMPTATIDTRNENDLSFTMLDGNVVDLTITPHTDGTILDVDVTLKNIVSAGLPQDVPIYPGATVQIITPGSAEFQVNADIKTLEDYYNKQLTAAGWAPSDSSVEASGSYIQDWTKGDQKITISLVTSDSNTMLGINCPSCNP